MRVCSLTGPSDPIRPRRAGPPPPQGPHLAGPCVRAYISPRRKVHHRAITEPRYIPIPHVNASAPALGVIVTSTG
jgi:hypothetical protein